MDIPTTDTTRQPMSGIGFDALVRARYSCRAFQAKAVDRTVIDAILADARHAPSWCNVQPWTLHLVQGQALANLCQRMSQETPAGPSDVPFPPAYSGIYRERRQASGWQLYDALGITREDHAARAAQTARNFICFDAPHLAILSCPRDMGPYAMLDCGGFLAHFQLAAQARGVNTIAQAAIAHHCPLLHRELAISQDLAILCGISFGYGVADDRANSYRTARANSDDFTHWIGE